MNKRNKFAIILWLLLVFISANVFCQETEEPGKIPFIFVGINPITVFFSYYEGEISIPISGLLEIGAQFSYLDIKGFLTLLGAENVATTAYMLHAGGVLRLFPSQQAKDFFISGRIMMLKAADSNEDYDFSDVAAGLDIGWRWRWDLDSWGIYVQMFAGIERAITQQETLKLFPILFVAGLHLGVCF